jgi:hypothetical protein
MLPDGQNRQTAKTETELDQYQVGRYDAWYRHCTLSVMAGEGPKKLCSGLIGLTLGEVRRLLAHLITILPSRAAARAWSRWRRHHQHLARTSQYLRPFAGRLGTAAGIASEVAGLAFST